MIIAEPSPTYVFDTGQQPAGATSDINIYVDQRPLDFWYLNPNPGSGTGSVPVGFYDATTVFLHEVGHGLGFGGYYETQNNQGILTSNGKYESPFDVYIQTHPDGSADFIGPQAEAVEGGPVPLTTIGPPGSNYYHLENAQNDVMTGTVLTTGVAYQISKLDLAILADTGVPLVPGAIASAPSSGVGGGNLGSTVSAGGGGGSSTVTSPGTGSVPGSTTGGGGSATTAGSGSVSSAGSGSVAGGSGTTGGSGSVAGGSGTTGGSGSVAGGSGTTGGSGSVAGGSVSSGGAGSTAGSGSVTGGSTVVAGGGTSTVTAGGGSTTGGGSSVTGSAGSVGSSHSVSSPGSVAGSVSSAGGGSSTTAGGASSVGATVPAPPAVGGSEAGVVPSQVTTLPATDSFLFVTAAGTIFETAGSHTIVSDHGSMTVNATGGNSIIFGSTDGDLINEGPSTEFVTGASGVSTVNASAGGADTIFAVTGIDYNGAPGANSLFVGGAGAVTVTAAQNEAVFAGPGGGIYTPGRGSFFFAGGGGRDTVVGNAANTILWTADHEQLTLAAGSASVPGANIVAFGDQASVNMANGGGHDSVILWNAEIGSDGNAVGFTGNTTLVASNAGDDVFALFSGSQFGTPADAPHTITIANWQASDILDLSFAQDGAGHFLAGYTAADAASAQSQLAAGSSFTLSDGTTVAFQDIKPTTVLHV